MIRAVSILVPLALLETVLNHPNDGVIIDALRRLPGSETGATTASAK